MGGKKVPASEGKQGKACRQPSRAFRLTLVGLTTNPQARHWLR